jgi:glutathione S-transferase
VSIKLYYHPFSTYSRRVLIAFAEKQIPHELVAVDMAARKHREQPYLSLNPYGRVPTLDEDGLSRQRSSPISRRPVRRRHWRRAGRASGRSWTCT